MSSTDPREDLTSKLESERAAVAGLPAADPVRRQWVGRLQAAWTDLRAALFVLGVNSVEQWLATMLELEVLLKAMAWDQWCPHHGLRGQCPAATNSQEESAPDHAGSALMHDAPSRLLLTEGMVAAPRHARVRRDAHHSSR